MNKFLTLEAALPDGTREDITVPADCLPRAGDWVQIAGHTAPDGTPKLFTVLALHLQVGRSAEQFRALLLLESAPLPRHLHLVHPAGKHHPN